MSEFTKATFYAPYLSDDDKSDTSSVGSDSEDEFTPEAPKMEFGRGPTQMTYVPFANAKEQPPLTGTSKNPTSDSRNTNIIVVNSRDRDTSVYPNPTFFTLRLPRVYRNVTTINLTEIALLNSFFNFRVDKGNLTLPLKETGRPLFEVSMRQGSYSAGELVAELNSALNQTPLFANIGFASFKTQFKNTGDFTILFNEPNGQIFNYQTQQYDTARTKQDIVNRYFQTATTFGIINFTNLQCLIAYYYPCIKEMVLRLKPFDYHVAEYQALPAYTLYPNPLDYILFGFTGLNDPYISILVQDSANLALFDAFHTQNTFLVYPVNRYVCSYDSRIGRFRITAPSINTSISSDISTQYNKYLNNLAYEYGYNGISALSNSLNTNNNLKGVRLDFYNFIHKQLSDYFGIDFGTYGADFFVNPNNQLTLYNTKDKLGWINDSNNLPETFISSFPIALPDVPVYWPNLRPSFSTATDGISTINFVSTYNLGALNFSSGTEYKKGFVDLSFNIFPTTYARVTFNSGFRQSVDLMTIPRFETERFSTNGEVYKFGSSIQETPFLFSTFGGPILSEPFNNIDYIMYDVSHVLFKTPDYMRFQGTQWLNFIRQNQPVQLITSPPPSNIVITSFRPHIIFRILPATIHAIPNAAFNIDIYVETQSGNAFPVPLTLTYYKDRSAFMADFQQDLSGNYTENNAFYFQSEEFSNTNSARITVRVVNNQYGYLMVNIGPNATALPGNLPLRVFAVNSDDFSISSITTAEPLDYRLMPWLSTGSQTQLYDEVDPTSNIFKDPLTYIFSTASDFFQLGYDSNNISNNLLDYMIQGTDNTYYDPYNIEDYVTNEETGLQYVLRLPDGGQPTPAPETTNWELYFPLNTNNTIEDTYSTVFLSTGATILTGDHRNEHTLVNWFKPTNGAKEYFLKPYPNNNNNYKIDNQPVSSFSTSVPVFQTCINPYTPLQTDMSTFATYDNNGTSGMQFFLPPSEITKLRDLTLKFAYTSPSFTNNSLEVPIRRNYFHKSLPNYGDPVDYFVNTSTILLDNQAREMIIPITSVISPAGETYFAYSKVGTIPGGTSTGLEDLVVGKLNANGVLQWAVQTPSINYIGMYQWGPKLCLSPSGYLYLAYISYDPGIQFATMRLRRLDPSNGNVLYATTVSPFEYVERLSLVCDQYDNATIFYKTYDPFNQSAVVGQNAIRYTPTLTIDLTFSFSYFTYISGVSSYEQGEINAKINGNDEYVLVYPSSTPLSGSSMTGQMDIIVVKYDYNGNVIWDVQTDQFNITGGKNTSPQVTIDSNDNIYVSYTIVGPNPNKNVLFKLDNDGNFVWLKNTSISTGDQDTRQGISINSNNQIALSFFTLGNFNNNSPYPGQVNLVVLLMNTDGDIIWCNQNNDITTFGILNIYLTDGVIYAPFPVTYIDNDYIYIGYQNLESSVQNVVFMKFSLSFILTQTFAATNSFYTTQNSDPDADSVFETWDDWYLPNRRNLKIGIYPTDQISSLHISSILLEDSIGTLTLEKICQVCNYNYSQFNLRTREPEWGTYYTYSYNPTQKVLYDVATLDMFGTAKNWTSTVVGADYVPSFTDADGTNVGYFLTHSTINNYNNLPRNYGIADSVGYTMNTPYSTISNWLSDIPNSYTAIPFYYNVSTSTWEVGGLHGLSYTQTPLLPTPSTLGANPYFGPMGHLQFSLTNASTFTINSTGSASYNTSVYFNSKLTFEKMDSCYNPALDLSSFGNFSTIQYEFQDTRMFFYENLSSNKDYIDIYSSTLKLMIYGQEKAVNYSYRDDNSGFNFLSYIPNATIRSSLYGSTCNYAVHVRGQVPTVGFTTGLRLMGKNYTDFGLLSFNEMFDEIQQLSGYIPIGPSASYQLLTTNSTIINNSSFSYKNLIDNNNSIRYNLSSNHHFTHDYADELISFDHQFSVGTVTYGINLVNSYPGVTFSFFNFSTALSSYVGFYNDTFADFSTINGIFSEANEEIQVYISTTYSGILPPQFIERSKYTDPLTFQLLFSTTLVAPYTTAFDEWGLGWNLGFAKKDTPTAVSHVSDTFIRIVADYVYLQLNQAYSMNGLSATEKENLSLTREAMGQDRRYFAKIILNSFAGISRVAVQMPKEFNPPIQKFDTLEFQLVDKYGRPINNSDCDSDMVLQVTETRTDLTIKTATANNIVS